MVGASHKSLTVLAWDTATPWCVIALERFLPDGSSCSLGSFVGTEGTASQTLPQAVEQLLKEAHLNPKEIDLLAVGRGPGSFTGLRVGLALAKGLALGADLDLVGICTLEAVAYALAESKTKTNSVQEVLVAPVIDAHHGQIFTALYRVQAEGNLNCLKPPQPVNPSELEAELLPLASGENILLGGPAVSVLSEIKGEGPLSSQLIVAPEPKAPSASGLARLAWAIARNGPEAIKANPPIPMYIRQPQIWSTGLTL